MRLNRTFLDWFVRSTVEQMPPTSLGPWKFVLDMGSSSL